jgi:putative flippase GtrA
MRATRFPHERARGAEVKSRETFSGKSRDEEIPAAGVSVVRKGGWTELTRSRRLRRQDPLPQFARFLLVGVGNTVVSFTTYRLFLALEVPYVIAATLGFSVGAVNGYVFNRRWTFVAHDTARARLLYIAVQAAGAASTSLLVFFFVRVAGTGRVAAYLATIPPVTVCMFTANRLWTFVDRSDGSSA